MFPLLPADILAKLATPRVICVGVAVLAISAAGGYVLHLRGAFKAAETHVELNADDAAGRGLEAQGAATIGNAATDAAQNAGALRNAADQLDAQARTDPAAATPLPADLLARLRAGDGQLCGAGAGVACRGTPAP